MEKELKTDGRYRGVFWIVVGAAIVAWFGYQALRSHRELEETRAAIEQARQQVTLQEQENREKLREIYGLQNDPYLIEKRLREQTKQARPGEIPLNTKTPAASDPELK